MREPWVVLRVPSDADEETIRRAYRRLVKEYHPDLSKDARQAARNSRKLEEVMEAYRNLLRRQGGDSPGPRAGGRAPRGPAPTSRTAGRRHTVDPERWARYGELLISGKNPSIRAMAAKTLGELGRRSAFGYLRQAFEDPDERVVCEAVRSVGRIRVRQARNELIALFPHGSPAVKHAILDCIEELGTLEEYGAVFQFALRDLNESVRTRGLRLLARYQKVRQHARKQP
ncbi:MAG: HEAT repeat domain-containing protein [Spirochaetota bacterium]